MNKEERKRKYKEAHKILHREINRGNVPPVNSCECAFCGKRAEAYHHDSYDFPLEVIPLCYKCHGLLHYLMRSGRINR